MSPRHVRLLLCRHTQIDLNVQGRYSGAREDVPLNAVGCMQAERLTEAISALPITAIYSSDLLRARQVASYIVNRIGATVIVYDVRLREVDIGEIGTMPKTEARAKFPEAHFNVSSSGYDFRSIGGEARQQVIDRQIACFNEILTHHGSRDLAHAPIIVVIGHGTSLQTMLEHLNTGMELHEQGDYQIIVYSV